LSLSSVLALTAATTTTIVYGFPAVIGRVIFLYQVFSYYYYQNILHLLINTANPVIGAFDVNPKIPSPRDVTEHSNSVVTTEAQVSDNVGTTNNAAVYVYTKETTETVQAKPYKAFGYL
jgi:hypothetical protein